MLFYFSLEELDRIPHWTLQGKPTLNWFLLTKGQYWVEWKDFRFQANAFSSPRTRYELIEFVNDLGTLLPWISEPVPEDIAALLRSPAAFHKLYLLLDRRLNGLSSGPTRDRYLHWFNWIHQHSLDSLPLLGSPRLHFLRGGESMHLGCTRPSQAFEMPFELFIHAVEDFGERFFAAMEQQVYKSLHHSWGQVSFNESDLIRAQVRHHKAFHRQLKGLHSTPRSSAWDDFRRFLQEIHFVA